MHTNVMQSPKNSPTSSQSQLKFGAPIQVDITVANDLDDAYLLELDSKSNDAKEQNTDKFTKEIKKIQGVPDVLVQLEEAPEDTDSSAVIEMMQQKFANTVRKSKAQSPKKKIRQRAQSKKQDDSKTLIVSPNKKFKEKDDADSTKAQLGKKRVRSQAAIGKADTNNMYDYIQSFKNTKRQKIDIKKSKNVGKKPKQKELPNLEEILNKAAEETLKKMKNESKVDKNKPDDFDVKRRRMLKVVRKNSECFGQIKNQISNFLEQLNTKMQVYIDETNNLANELSTPKVKTNSSSAQSRQTSYISSKGFNGDIDDTVTQLVEQEIESKQNKKSSKVQQTVSQAKQNVIRISQESSSDERHELIDALRLTAPNKFKTISDKQLLFISERKNVQKTAKMSMSDKTSHYLKQKPFKNFQGIMTRHTMGDIYRFFSLNGQK